MRQIEATEIYGRDDWRLIVATVHYRGSIRPQLPAAVSNAIDKAAWALNDAYGEVGFVPCQGWDWSGIRDSSAGAKATMAATVRALLEAAGLEVTFPEQPAELARPCPKCGAEAGDLCIENHTPLFGADGYDYHDERKEETA